MLRNDGNKGGVRKIHRADAHAARERQRSERVERCAQRSDVCARHAKARRGLRDDGAHALVAAVRDALHPLGLRQPVFLRNRDLDKHEPVGRETGCVGDIVLHRPLADAGRRGRARRVRARRRPRV
jgi:hypothetical protein